MPASPEVHLLCTCLSFRRDGGEAGTLRARLAAGMWDGVLKAATERSLLPALAEQVERRQLTAGIPSFAAADGTMTITRALEAGVARHREGRVQRLARLVELVLLLNAEGIEPILLKGARSLWTGQPAWRVMGDLDLLTPGRAAEAQRLALAAGYETRAGYENPHNWHHELNLYRDDLPGWLEFHDRGAMVRADHLLPTSLLIAESQRREGEGGAVARLLPPALDLLYGLVHHHVSHRGDKFGLMNLKGLYEFAAGFAVLSSEELASLSRLAGSHPRLVAMLDLWLAAAVDRFGLELPQGWHVPADAAARWAQVDGQEDRRGDYDGVLAELRLGLSGARLRRVDGGGSWLGRQRLRAIVLRSLLAPATVTPDAKPQP